MDAIPLQLAFFQHLKENLPPHLSLVDEVADHLSISNDSAYRRIRGEKPMSFDEIATLCGHYKLSLDQFLHLQTDNFIFSGRLNNHSPEAFEEYLENLLQNFQLVNSFSQKHMYILLKDMPHFIHFHIPELAAFKFFLWMKSILHFDSMKAMKFSLNDEMYEKYYAIGKKVIALYNRIPITEIWNIENINSTIRQFNFYAEAGAFKNKSDLKILYQKLEELVNHIERQAELGCKFSIGKEPDANSGEYRLFVNELILGDNTYLAELDQHRITFLNHSVLYFVATRDERFNRAIHENIQNLIKKSTMISTVGEKDRSRFFDQLRERIHERLALLK